jgi:hypothetical protein
VDTGTHSNEENHKRFKEKIPKKRDNAEQREKNKTTYFEKISE